MGLKVEVRGVSTALLPLIVGRGVATAVRPPKGRGGGAREAEPRGGGTRHVGRASVRTRVEAAISVR